MTNIDNKFTKEKEGVANAYGKTLYEALCAIAVGASGGMFIKNALDSDNKLYVALACIITAASFGAFVFRGVSNYALARVLDMELRKKQKALAKQNIK